MAASRNLALAFALRLQADLEALARPTRPDRPYTRRALAEHLAAGARVLPEWPPGLDAVPGTP
jgi:hypothetical protein